MNYLKLKNGETLTYHEVGTGNNVMILIHGNMCSKEHFAPLLDQLPKYFFKAYAIDLRGFGDSTYYKKIKSIKAFSEDIYDFIEQLGLTSVTLVGWSAGGAVCLQLGADHSEIVHGIVLLSSVGYQGDPIVKKDQQGKAIGGFYANKYEMAKDPEVYSPLLALKNGDFQAMNDLWARGIYTCNQPSAKDNEKFIYATLKQRNLIDVYWALAHFNMSNMSNGYIEGNGFISTVTSPVLSYWGEKDVIIPKVRVEETVSALPNAELRILSDCGHAPLIDCLDEVKTGIYSFVKEKC